MPGCPSWIVMEGTGALLPRSLLSLPTSLPPSIPPSLLPSLPPSLPPFLPLSLPQSDRGHPCPPSLRHAASRLPLHPRGGYAGPRLLPTRPRQVGGRTQVDLPCQHETGLNHLHPGVVTIATRYQLTLCDFESLTLYTPYSTRMSPESTHKLMGFHMEVLVLGVIL